MRYVLIGLLFLTGCAGLRPKDTCDSYCFSTGGQCNYIIPGERRYDTQTHDFSERPTVFYCRYNN